MKKIIIFSMLLGVVTLLGGGPAPAITLGFNPVQDVISGDLVNVGLFISGLENSSDRIL